MPSSYAIGEHFEQFIRLQIDSGRYTNASEVVRASLRLLEDQEKLRQMQLEEMRQLIRDGAESGLGQSADAVFDRLEARYGDPSAACEP
ncbi:type II toxin-antitoxin system ParD family antitoxin [Gloeobacter violaceus]|uniref:Gsr3999 protein n=1 Tax=Gloeobacter violaceus (strain ATCC 29082 / PCC 7421) TaxID=251221 RepID=Q7NE81_GLOVI|nr:type II toxin-antitoxin system ParD family antitoxin [Gloeobacter violaceus]BAC91940.1 gsr3999 [Gloeobacter violaceus PCC 7421]